MPPVVVRPPMGPVAPTSPPPPPEPIHLAADEPSDPTPWHVDDVFFQDFRDVSSEWRWEWHRVLIGPDDTWLHVGARDGDQERYFAAGLHGDWRMYHYIDEQGGFRQWFCDSINNEIIHVPMEPAPPG